MVYAVWFDMVASDSRERWTARVLDDPRVHHYWDEERVVGRWFGGKPGLGDCGEIAWDAYYLFPANARWKGTPAPLTVSGCPVVREREKLAAAIDALARQRESAKQRRDH